MRMNAELLSANVFGDIADNVEHFIGHGAAICVAQDNPTRTGLQSGIGASQRVFAIGLIAVEKMLAINHRLFAARRNGGNTIGDAS